MDLRLTRIILLSLPLLALVFWGAGRMLGPFLGAMVGLWCYWALLAWLTLRDRTREEVIARLIARWPGWPIAIALILPVFVTGILGMRHLDGGLPVWILPPLVLGAAINGTLEELFWRDRIIPDDTPRAAAMALVLFTLWHLAILPVGPLPVTGGWVGLLGGAFALGGVWMAARLMTGSPGAGILSHAGVNLFVFMDTAARALPATA